MATYKEVFNKNFRGQLPQMIQNFRFSFQQSDSFITWITGFDIIGITLIIANADKIKYILGSTGKWVVILLFLSIILGIIYKLMSLPMLARLMQAELRMKIFFTDEQEKDHDETDVEEKAYKAEVKEFIEGNFGITERWKKFTFDVNKKMYPRGFYIGIIFYSSIFLTIAALFIMILDYIC